MPDPFSTLAATPLDAGRDALNAVQPAPEERPEAVIRSTGYEQLASVYGNEFTKGLRRGALGALGTTQGFAAQVAEPFSTELSNKLFDEANKTLDFEKGLRPSVEKWADVHDPSSFLHYGLSKAGEALPSTALSIGAAGLGGTAGLGLRALTGARVPLGFAAGAGSMLPQEAGEAALTMRNDPEAMARTTPWQRLGLSTAKGGINAALEFAPEAVALRRAFGAPRIRRGFGRGLAETGIGLAEGAANEAITEGLQEKSGQIFHGFANPARDTAGDPEAIREAMLGGAFGGAGMGAVGGGIHALRSNVPEMPNMPELPAMDMEAGMRAGYKGAKVVHEAFADIKDWVSNLGKSVDQTVKPSLEWSEAKGEDLKRLMADPEVDAALKRIEADDEDARNLVVTLHSFRNAPKRLESPRGQRILARLDAVFGPNAYERLDGIIQQTGKGDYSNVGPAALDLPKSNVKQVFQDPGEATDDETSDEVTDDDGGQEGFLNEVFPRDQLGVNKQILSDAFQNRAHYLYSGVEKGKTVKDIPMKFTSDTLSPQEFMKLLTTRDFKTEDKPYVRPFNDKEIAYHTQKGYAELPISPMSLSMALSTAYKDQLGQLREGKETVDASRKADIFMAAMSTLMNEGIAITDAQGKKHHINVEMGEGAEEAKPIMDREGNQRLDKTGKPMVKRDLPDNLLLVQDKQLGEYTVGHYKAEVKKGFNRTKDEALGLEREYLQKFGPHLSDDEMWEKTYKTEKKNAPYGSPRNKALYAVYKGREKFHDKLQWNIRNTVVSGLDAIKEDITARVRNQSDETGNPEDIINDLREYLGSEGMNVPSSIRQLFKKNNVPLFSEATLSSDALQNKKGMRPHDYLLRDLEELQKEAREGQTKGVFSKTEQNEAVGEDAETANVPGIGNTVWNKGQKVKLHERWKGSFNEPVTQKVKNGIIKSLREWKNYLQTNGKWRVESAGGKRAGFFKTKEEAQNFINNIPADGYRLLDADGKLYTLDEAKEAWPRWKERLRENNYSIADLSIVNPETSEILELGGHAFSKLPREAGVHYLNAIHKTLRSGGLKPVDSTPMFTMARALPVDVAKNINEGEFSPEQIEAFRREYGTGRRPLTEADLEKRIQVQGAVEAGRAGGNKFLSPAGKVYNEGKQAATAQAEGTKGVKPELRSKAATLQAIETNKRALEEGGITDDFGTRMLMQRPHQQAVVPVRTWADEEAERLAAKRSKKEVEEEGVTDEFGNRVQVALPHQAEIEQQLKEKETKEREARGEEEPKVLPRYAQPPTARPDIHAVSRKRAEEEDAADETDTDILRTTVQWFNTENEARKAEQARIEATPDNESEVREVAERKARGGKTPEEAEIINAEEARIHKDYDELQLFLRGQLDADIARRAGEDRTYDPKAGMLFSESQSSSYQPRTRRNASADATIAIAADFNSGGERLTKSSTLGQKKKYVPVSYNGEEKATDEQVDEAVALLNEIPKEWITLNIAGNGIYTLKRLGNQEKVDAYTLDFLKRVVEHPELNKRIIDVRTGGQTGFDEAGAKAGRELGFPTEVHAPKGWAYRVIDETNAKGYRDIYDDEAGFKARFIRPEGQPYPVITAKPKVPSSPVEPLTRHETLDGLKASQKTKLAFTDNKGNIHLVIPNIEADFKSGFNYMFGGLENPENISESAAQKRIMVKQMGLTKELFSTFIPDLETYEKFLQAHEQSHIDNNDRAKYPKHEDGSLDLLNKKAIEIERRATLDGLKAIAPAPATPSTNEVVRDEPMSFPMAAKDNVTGKATTTLQLVKDGVRTATTRHWARLPKVGDVLNFHNRDKTDSVKVRVTSVGPRLGTLFEGKDKNEVLTELSKAEGWTPEAFIAHYNHGRTVNDDSRQVTYERLEKPAAPAASTAGARTVTRSDHIITRAEIKANPDTIYVFGDNWARRGFGGAAAEARGEPNAVGVATKKAPARNDGAYLNDAQLEHNKKVIDEDFAKIPKNKNVVIMPMGVGLAELPTRAPKTWAYLQSKIRELTGEAAPAEVAAPTAPVAKAENIASPFSGRNTSKLASALTNVTYAKYPVDKVPGLTAPDPTGNHRMSAEAWYKKNSTGKLAHDMPMMQKIIEAKLRQYPELVQQIDEKGGADWIAASEHTVVGNARWEGKGLESNFLKVLHDAYNAVKASSGLKESRQTIETPGVADQLRKVMEANGFVYDERLVDALPSLLDIAGKTLNPKSMQQAAQGLSFLMVGHPDFQAILPELQKTALYAEHMADLKGTQSRAYLEAARRVLASLIEKNLVDRNVPQNLLDKILKMLQKVWNHFNETVAPKLTNAIDTMIDKVLKEEGYLTRPDKPGYEEVNFQKAVNSDELAGRILKTAGESNATLTGSLAYAAQTKVYRPPSAAIHDLDFLVKSPEQAKEFARNLNRDFPDSRIVNNFFDGKLGVTTILVPPTGTQFKNVSKSAYILVDSKTGKDVGSYTKTKESERQVGQQAKAVDIIISPEQSGEKTTTHNFKVEGEPAKIELISTQSGVAAKLRMLREKDLWDYQRYNPAEKPSIKESNQAQTTPGWDPAQSTTEEILNRLISLAEKMFGKKVALVLGVPPNASATGARGWYQTHRTLPQFKANEARIKEVRSERREALKRNDRAEVDKLNAEEASLLKQNEVVGTIYLNPSLANREMFPTYYHEALHAAFDILLTPAEKAILATAFTQGTVRRQLENLFKDDAAVLGQMKDAEEAAAYGFQIYSAAPHLLQLGPKVEGMFQKVARWFKKMFGALSPEEKAQIIMDEMLSGKRQETGLSPLQRLLDKDMTFQQKVAKHATALKELMQKLWEVVATPSYDRLIKTGNPALIALAKLGHTKTGEKGVLGMIQRMQNEMSGHFNWINKFTKKYTAEQIQEVAEHRMNNTMPTDPVLIRAYNDIDTFFNEFRKYAQKAGVDVGFIKNYWPMLWDAEKVMKGRTEFLQMISQQKYAQHLDDLKVTPTELWENISGYVTRGDTFQGIIGPTGEPVNAYSRERSLSFLDPEDRKPFMHDNPYQTMVNYVSHMVRQAEFVRSYGANGDIKNALLTEAADKYGATKEQLALANDYIDGLLGNKEVGMSRELKDLYGAAVVYQNYRLLPFNLFTSLVDPLGIAIRSGRIGDALEAFIYSLKKIFRDLKKDRPDSAKDEWERLAEDWGYIEDAGTMANLRHMMETTELRGFSKKMNDALFKWNLLNGWTRSTKIMAVKAAQRFMANAAKGTDKHSIRHLEELGLKPSDVIETQEGNIALRKDEFMAQGMSEEEAEKAERRMRDAMTKFVNQAILNPTAADLPNWGSNPYLAPIFHLKQFMFTFQTTIMSRIWQEAKEGNLKPLWISGIYIPGMIAADAMRGFVSNMGEQPPWQKDWGPVDYLKNGVSRSGLLGSGQMIASMQDDVMHGGRGYESMVGPTAEQFMKGLQAVSKGDTALWNFVVKSMPLAPIFDQWLISSKPGPMGEHFGSSATSATSE